MHKRRTLKERRQRKIRNFELMHPKNKYVIRRQEMRAWLSEMKHRLFSEVITEMAMNGDPHAKMIVNMFGLISNEFSLL